MNSQVVHDETLASLMNLATKHLAADWTGLAMSRNGTAVTLAATANLVDTADRLQTRHADGPTITPAWPTPQVAVNARTRAGPWPHWTQALLDLGIEGILSTQVLTPTGQTGSLTLYYARAVTVSDDARVLAQVLADQAATHIHQTHTIAHLNHAIDTRLQIGQAQGILIERFGLTPQTAFNVLKRHSQDTNLKLRDVAQTLVSTGHLPPDSIDAVDELETLLPREAPLPAPPGAPRRTMSS